MTRIFFLGVVTYFFLQWITYAVPPMEIVAAKQVAPIVLGTAQDILQIPGEAINLLYLPRGLAKIGLSPLPGATIAGGLKDVNSGITALSRTTARVLYLPFNLMGRSIGRAKNMIGIK